MTITGHNRIVEGVKGECASKVFKNFGNFRELHLRVKKLKEQGVVGNSFPPVLGPLSGPKSLSLSVARTGTGETEN